VTKSRLHEKENEVQDAVEYFGAKSNLSKSSLIELARSGMAKSALKQSGGVAKSGISNKVSVLDSQSNFDRVSVLSSIRMGSADSKISLLEASGKTGERERVGVEVAKSGLF
jgi:hypothetical protein